MSKIFNVIISNGGKILSNVKVVVTRQVKRENSSLPVAVRGSKNVACLNSLLGTLRSTTATSTKTSPQNKTLLYYKSFAIIPSRSRVLQYGRSILKINWYERFQSENRE